MKIQSSVDFEEPQLDHDLFQAASRQCQSAASWNAMTMAAMSVAVSIDPYKPSLPENGKTCLKAFKGFYSFYPYIFPLNSLTELRRILSGDAQMLLQ